MLASVCRLHKQN